jgi:phage tail sheath protein FI
MPNLGPFPHGVSWQDVPTSVIAPVAAYPGINVVVGSAPLWQTPNGKAYLNVPRVYNSYEEAVAEQGYSNDWATYDICEHMDAVFVEFGMFPVIYIACNDVFTGATVHPASSFTLVGGQIDTALKLINDSTLIVSGPSGTPVYAEGTDYLKSLSDNSTWVITRIATGAIASDTATIQVAGEIPSSAPVTAAIIIGGIDASGKNTGLQAIEDVFQKTGYVPGIVICPAFSSQPTVAAAMEAKCENINGCFAATCIIDVDTATVKKASDVLNWKNNVANAVFPRQQVCFGHPALVGAITGQPGSATQITKVFHFASQQGPLCQWTDTYKGQGMPYCSPSNKNLRMNSLQDGAGAEIPMHLVDANMLNSQGVITALNWIGGWRSWGNRTACYPSDTDVKDMFIPVRRMFDYIGNTIVLTIWQEVDEPGNRRLIDAVVNSIQMWLDGITATGALIGAAIQFNQNENPATEILNGHYVFHVYIAVPTPAEWLDFRIEYWIPYIDNLWPSISTQITAPGQTLASQQAIPIEQAATEEVAAA